MRAHGRTGARAGSRAGGRARSRAGAGARKMARVRARCRPRGRARAIGRGLARARGSADERGRARQGSTVAARAGGRARVRPSGRDELPIDLSSTGFLDLRTWAPDEDILNSEHTFTELKHIVSLSPIRQPASLNLLLRRQPFATLLRFEARLWRVRLRPLAFGRRPSACARRAASRVAGERASGRVGGAARRAAADDWTAVDRPRHLKRLPLAPRARHFGALLGRYAGVGGKFRRGTPMFHP